MSAMNESKCIEAGALDEILASAVTDPRRRHLESCPRCRALAENYALFLSPPDDDPALTDRAQAKLDAFRDRLLAPTDPIAAPRRAMSGAAPWWRGLFAPAARPAWALAGVLVIAGAWYVTRPSPPSPADIRLRGEQRIEMPLAAPRYLDANTLVLGWRSMPEAARYEVRFYSTSLTEIGRRDAGTDTLLRIAVGQLPPTYARGESVLYRVVALQGGDEISRSPVGSLQKH